MTNFKVKYSIQLAECFYAATALSHSAAVITGDPEFEKIQEDISIKWLPRK